MPRRHRRSGPGGCSVAEARLLSLHAIVPVYFYTSKHLVRPEVLGFEANPLDHHPSRWLRLRTPVAAKP